MSEDKKNWDNDSEHVDMTFFGDDEINEVKREEKAKEEETFDWSAEAESEEAKDEFKLREMTQGEINKTTGGSKTAPKKGPFNRNAKSRSSAPNKPHSPGVWLFDLPASYKRDDVKKLLTSGVKDPIEESKIENIKLFFNGKPRALVYFKDSESAQKIAKVGRVEVGGKYIRFSEYEQSHGSSSHGPRRTVASTKTSSASSSSSDAKVNPFGQARANDKQMNREREQIEEEQKKKAAAAAAAPAAATTEAPAPAAAEAPAAAPAAAPAGEAPASEAKPEEKPAEAKPEEKPAEAKPEEKPAAAVKSSAPVRNNAKNKKVQKKGAKPNVPVKDTKAEEEKKKALKKQQKEREKKRKLEADEQRKKDKTFNPFGALGDDE